MSSDTVGPRPQFEHPDEKKDGFSNVLVLDSNSIFPPI